MKILAVAEIALLLGTVISGVRQQETNWLSMVFVAGAITAGFALSVWVLAT